MCKAFGEFCSTYPDLSTSKVTSTQRDAPLTGDGGGGGGNGESWERRCGCSTEIWAVRILKDSRAILGGGSAGLR